MQLIVLVVKNYEGGRFRGVKRVDYQSKQNLSRKFNTRRNQMLQVVIESSPSDNAPFVKPDEFVFFVFVQLDCKL